MPIGKENKEKISQCLQCPIYRFVLSDYILNFYLEWKKNKEDYATDGSKKTVERILKALRIDIKMKTGKSKRITEIYEYDRKLKILENFSIKNAKIPYSVFPETSDCVAVLNQVLSLIVCFIERSEEDNDDVIGKEANIVELSFNQDAMFVLQKMRELVDLDNPAHSNLHTECNEIIENFCDERKRVKYRFCNPIYFKDPNYFKDPIFATFPIAEMDLSSYNLRDCQSQRFQAKISRLDNPTFLDINVLNTLDDHSKQILQEFILLVPKSFGSNLLRLMNIQGITENDLAKLLGVEVNAIQSLCKCKEPNRTPDEIKKLARALLVSEDMLYCGKGEIYGNWKDLLNLCSDSSTYEILEVDRKSDAKERIRNIIRDIIFQDETTYMDMLKHNFFHKRQCCLYMKNCEDENSYDYNAMYQAALNQKEIDLLISVLKRFQPSDKEST